MGRGLGNTEKYLLFVFKDKRYGSPLLLEEIKLTTFTFKQLCEGCGDTLSKEQIHSALGRLVRRGLVLKTTGKRPQKYWILPNTKRLLKNNSFVSKNYIDK